MDILLSIIILAVWFLLVGLVFYYTPYNDYANRTKFIKVMIIFFLLIILIPNDLICKIQLPFINDTLENFISQILQKISIYSSFTELDPEIASNVLFFADNIAKGVFCVVLISIITMLSSIILCIYHFIKYKKYIFRTILGTTFIILLSAVMLCSPIHPLLNLYTCMNEALVTEESTLLEENPELNEYKNEIQLIESLNTKLDQPVLKYISGPFVCYTLNYSNMLTKELKILQVLKTDIKNAGLSTIFSDDFDFTQLSQSTFDFDKLSQIIDTTVDSNIYSHISLQITNKILRTLSQTIQEGTNESFTPVLTIKDIRELKQELPNLIKLLKIALDFDLINIVENTLGQDLSTLTYSKFIDTIKDILNGVNKSVKNLSALKDALSIINDSLTINKIKNYKDFSLSLSAATYLSLNLYNALNNWLSNFRNTSSYISIKNFMTK